MCFTGACLITLVFLLCMTNLTAASVNKSTLSVQTELFRCHRTVKPVLFSPSEGFFFCGSLCIQGSCMAYRRLCDLLLECVRSWRENSMLPSITSLSPMPSGAKGWKRWRGNSSLEKKIIFSKACLCYRSLKSVSSFNRTVCIRTQRSQKQTAGRGGHSVALQQWCSGNMLFI